MSSTLDSGPTTRVIDVLNFLSAHPEQKFSLADIARAVGLSNGSAHRILTAMTAAHFLARDEKHRAYSLGLALVGLGQAAVQKHRGIDLARREIARLAAALDVQCSASVAAGSEILVLAKEGAPPSHVGLTRVGERRRFVPPFGLCLVAWSGEAAIDSYIARAGGHLGEAACRHLGDAMKLIRSRGYAVAALGPNAAAARQATALPPGPRPDADWQASLACLTPDEIQLFELRAATPAGFATISAPVFSESGTVAMQLVISGLAPGIGGEKIEIYAARLTAAAARVTSELHGRLPPL